MYENRGCLDYVGIINAFIIVRVYCVRMCCFEYVDEPDNSEVHAFWEDDGTMTATIKTDSDVYYIEVSLVLFKHLTYCGSPWQHLLCGVTEYSVTNKIDQSFPSRMHRYAVNRTHRYMESVFGLVFLTSGKPVRVPYRIKNV